MRTQEKEQTTAVKIQGHSPCCSRTIITAHKKPHTCGSGDDTEQSDPSEDAGDGGSAFTWNTEKKQKQKQSNKQKNVNRQVNKKNEGEHESFCSTVELQVKNHRTYTFPQVTAA